MDTPVVHLSVHPSAWTNTFSAASSPQSSDPTPFEHRSPQPLTQRTPGSTTSGPTSSAFHFTPGLPLSFITHHHTLAMHTLIHGRPPLPIAPDLVEYALARSFAQTVLQVHGMAWPRIQDEEYPPVDDSIEGVKYEQVVIERVSCSLRLILGLSYPTTVQQFSILEPHNARRYTLSMSNPCA